MHRERICVQTRRKMGGKKDNKILFSKKKKRKRKFRSQMKQKKEISNEK